MENVIEMRGAWRENFMRQFKPNNHRGATVMTEGIPLVMTAIDQVLASEERGL